MADTGLPDIHAGQVIFASIRAGGNRTKTNVAGKDAAGRPLTLAPETQAVESDLPKLIWMKHRIDGILQGGKTAKPLRSQRRRIWSAAARLSLPGTTLKKWPSPRTKSTSRASVLRESLCFPTTLPR